jgi:hypothetical protein
VKASFLTDAADKMKDLQLDARETAELKETLNFLQAAQTPEDMTQRDSVAFVGGYDGMRVYANTGSLLAMTLIVPPGQPETLVVSDISRIKEISRQPEPAIN